MIDIVERLRDPSRGSPRWGDTMAEAADEIERLRAERDEAQAEANAGRQAEHDADVERRAVESERDRLREALQGRSWNEINACWIDGLNRARAELKEIS
jgi:hypothetical protein